MSKVIYRKLKEQFEELELEEDYQKFKETIEEEVKVNHPLKWVNALIKEMTDAEKRQFAKMIQMQNIRMKKAISELLLYKEVAMLCKSGSEMGYSSKKRCILAIMQIIQPILDEEKDLDGFIQRKSEWVSRYGIWHYYWALYFHPQRGTEEWKRELQNIEDSVQQHEGGPPESEEESESEREGSSGEPREKESPAQDDEKEIKIGKLEKKIKKEMEIRVALEKELDQKRKELNRSERELHVLREEVKRLQERNRMREEEMERLLKEWGEEKKRGVSKQQEWYEERGQLLQENKQLKQQLEAKGNEIQTELQLRDKEIQKLRQEANRLQKPKSRDELIDGLKGSLYQEVAQLTQILAKGEEGEERRVRDRLRLHLDFLDLLDEYRGKLEKANRPIPKQVEPVKGLESDVMIIPEEREEEEEKNLSGEVLPSVPVEPLTGIFYRRDHGGYIELEDGKSFSISESLVLNIGLEHGAGVACTPMGNGRYHIKLLYPGDDGASQVKKYFGYVELGEYHKWYCVDHSNPENRFLIHLKDLNILQPQDGTPCTFNVFEGSKIARISRLYSFPVEEEVEGGGVDSRGEPKPSRIPSKRIEEETEEERKIIPFLQGCRIAIVGGQRKWFEDVVLETGAELIHDDGQTPERIYADLKRSNALFFLLTANSHRATWGCMEIAKEYDIPHYIIRGSKSNLRAMLWEHREEIQNSSETNSKSGT
ncbi:DUF2325 domain-containing protein [Thermicanus aegyptius]|uniref:DUF2325 domain-containing protein n=1 Tax=Thermicanus aegyptius TaxID=94009 RepID=UPI00048B10BB|nr:DUF2325 domain-containing protein [Thermicanus aegyptius]